MALARPAARILLLHEHCCFAAHRDTLFREFRIIQKSMGR